VPEAANVILKRMQRMKNLSIFLFCALTAGSLRANLTIINVDIQGNGGPRDSVTGESAAHTDPAGATAIWNNSGLTGTNLTQSDGTATTVGYTITSANGGLGTFRRQNQTTPPTAPGGTGGIRNLLYDFAFQNNADQTLRVWDLNITNLDAALTYDLYVYGGTQFADNPSSNVSFTVNGVTNTIDYSGAIAMNPTPIDSYVLGQNFTVFNGLTADVANEITLSASATLGEPTLSGFALVAVPEPSSGLLALFGFVPLLYRSRGRHI